MKYINKFRLLKVSQKERKKERKKDFLRMFSGIFVLFISM